MKHQQSTTQSPHPQLLRPSVLDLFGQVQITRADVYAWLLAVPDMDPSNPRAAAYIRDYGVIQKITAAKLEGSFEATTAAACDTARFRELVNDGSKTPGSTNVFGVGEWSAIQRLGAPMSRRLKAPNRPKEVIRKEKEEERKRRALGKQADTGMLCRLPKSTPPFTVMLDDIGRPHPERLAKAMCVSPQSVKRWIQEDHAPQAVMLALYWLTRWGTSTIDAHAHNDAVNSARLARNRQEEADGLRRQISKIEVLADFGSANDPLPQVSSRLPVAQSTHFAAASAADAPCSAPADRRPGPSTPAVRAA